MLPISEKHMDYGEKVLKKLQDAGIRAELDTRAEKIGYKIREGPDEENSLHAVVGAKEEEEEKVAVRSRSLGDEGQKGLEEFISQIQDEIRTKAIQSAVKEEEK